MNDWTGIVGANGQRRDNDFYETPKECVFALVDFLKIPRHERIWDSACGNGAIVTWLSDRGYPYVIGTDIQTGSDFMTESIRADWIITNPPFLLAEQFIRRADSFGIPFAFLLKSQFWHASRRVKLFREITPKYVLPMAWRPDFTGQGKPLMDVMWCVWTPEKTMCTQYIPLERPKEETNG